MWPYGFLQHWLGRRFQGGNNFRFAEGRRRGRNLVLGSFGSQFFLLLVWQLLVLLPLRRLLIRVQFFGPCVALPRYPSLVRRLCGPGTHALLDAHLFIRFHDNEFFDQRQPFAFVGGVELVPFGGQWRQCLLLRWR